MGDARQTTCPYCGTVMERPRSVAPEHVGEIEQSRPTVSEYGKRVRPRPERSASPRKYVTWAVFVAIVTAIAYYVVTSGMYAESRNAFRWSNHWITRAVPIPVENDDSLYALILTSKRGEKNYTLVYLDSSSQTVLWQSQSLSEEYYKTIIPGNSLIYLGDQSRLLAFSRDDGTLVWQASLADVLCQDCLNVFGDHLVALTEGGVLQGFDAQTGALVWSKRLTGTPDRLLDIAGQPAVLDPIEDDIMALHILNANDGDVVQQFAPLCQHSIFEEDLDLYSPVIFTPGDGALYLFFGNLATCVQRWDINTGEMTWATVIDETVHWHSADPLLASGAIYLGQEHGKIMAINAQDGRPNTLTGEPDYDLTPLARQDDTLIVRATRTRGSERDELWGLDAESGERRWQYLLQGEDWVHDTARGQWDCQLTSRGLVLLQVLSDPDQLIVETLDPLNGVSAGQVSTKVHDDYWGDVAWTDDVAWLRIRGKLYTVDLATGTLICTWP